jgi:putative transposase
MKTMRTIKIKITGSTKADKILPVWLSAINWLAGIVFKTKETNSNRLHKANYAALRELGLQSQLACSASKTVCAAYKTAKTNGKWRQADFKSAVIPIVWRRDFNRTKKGITLWGEVLTLKDRRELPKTGWKDSKLRRVGRQWFLILSHEIEVPEPKSDGCIVGVDLGIKRMIVASNSDNNKPFFFKGGELSHRRQGIRRTRAAIQSVGTRSSRRLLKRMSGNEAAVTGHLTHVASKALVNYAVSVGARRIVLENLSNIRDASLSKGKNFRSKIHRWPYADLRSKTAYKSEAVGIAIEVVSPRNTSRCCCKCGWVSASNRKGLVFLCEKCGNKDDADLQASKNIRARSVSIACNAMESGSYKPPESAEPQISNLDQPITAVWSSV